MGKKELSEEVMLDKEERKRELKYLQSLPLEVKVRMTQNRIREWVDYFGENSCYVSISGGKDSQVLAHIVRGMYKNIPLVFINTGLEYNSVRQKGEELADDVLRPEKNFIQVITEYGYPLISKEVSRHVHDVQKLGSNCFAWKMFNGSMKGNPYNKEKYKWLLNAPFRISNKCCDIMKKNPAHKYDKTTGRVPFIGTMTEESMQRRTQWIKSGCNSFETNKPSSKPISFWTEQDILRYIQWNNLDIAEVYKDVVEDENGRLKTTGLSRSGCVFCGYGINSDKERFLRLKENEPKKYEFVFGGGRFDECGLWIPFNGLGYKFVIDWLNEHGNMDIKY